MHFAPSCFEMSPSLNLLHLQWEIERCAIESHVVKSSCFEICMILHDEGGEQDGQTNYRRLCNSFHVYYITFSVNKSHLLITIGRVW